MKQNNYNFDEFFIKFEDFFEVADVKVEFDERAFSSYHSHDFVEIAYFEKGSGMHYIEEKQYSVSSGDLYILNSNVKHGFLSTDSPLKVINIIFKGDFLKAGMTAEDFIDESFRMLIGGQGIVEGVKTNYLHVSVVSNQNYGDLFKEILQEYENKQVYYIELLKKEIETILIKIYRNFKMRKSETGLSLNQKNIIEDFLKEVDDNFCIMSNYDGKIKKTGFCKLYFTRLFKIYTGISITKYVQKKRVEKACRLLIETNKTIEVICEDVGYNDLKHFFQVFKSVVGITPGKYRSKNFNNHYKKGNY